MPKTYLFEVCAINIQSASIAEQAGAQRIELCSALDVGGLTPSPGLILQAVRSLNIAVNVLIRPREGNFCYSDQELDVMLEDIRFCRLAGANGVVVGALDEKGNLDLPILRALKTGAGEMEIVHHRAFDFCNNPSEALEQLIELGYHRVLSSGQSNSAFEGRHLLKKLVDQAAGRISVMPGAGIDARTIGPIARETGALEFHFTGKVKIDPSAGNAIKGLDSWYWQSDEATIRQIIEAAQA
ncbi:MAG: copper homeostasis protein CutC [Saprospiraceae bacterium]|nr:copper homeostasis protein CutC [Saprospiraceae bacterium]